MWLTVLVIAIAAAMMMAVQEVPVMASSEIISTDYNIIELDAPALAGVLLTFVTRIATRTVLRPFIVRFLLNKNEVHLIRELAANKLVGVPPTYYPLARLSSTDYDYHVQAAAKSENILSQGLPSTFTGDYRSVMDYHKVYQSGKATPMQVLKKVLEGCQQLEHLHMFSSLRPDDVMEQAKESEERWTSGQPLSVFDGVPVAVKDIVNVQGHPLCFGSTKCSSSEIEDVMVARFRQIGAIILGVTVSTEGGVTPLGYSLAFDGPFNPYDPDYYPGGSSSGSAVVVAAGLAPVALGFDGGGSIRVPASMSGTFGLASTFGRVETNSALELTVVKAGPLAASTADMALAHLVLSQKDKTHFYSQLYDGGVSGVPPAHVSGLDHSVKGMRLGIYWDHFQHSDPEIVEACIQTVEFLKRQGAEIVNITIPHLREIHLSHGLKILSEIGVVWDSDFYDPNFSFEANTYITIAMGKELTAVEVLAGEKIRTWALVLHVDSVLLFCLCRYCT